MKIEIKGNIIYFRENSEKILDLQKEDYVSIAFDKENCFFVKEKSNCCAKYHHSSKSINSKEIVNIIKKGCNNSDIQVKEYLDYDTGIKAIKLCK